MPPAPIESSGSIKFDDQTFLISYFSEISARDNANGLPVYNNTFRLNNTTAFPMPQMIGIFNGTADLSPFLKLSTHQYSALIPRVRLYRLDYDTSGNKLSDKEFIFDKDYKYEITDILKTPKRSNSGIKRINWRLAGSNPVTAEKQVEVEIELYFDSINSFSSGDFDSMRDAWKGATSGITSTSFSNFNQFGSLDTETTTRNYWSLLFHPKISDKETTQESRESYDTNFFRIRANVGWEEVETNIKNQLFPDIDINEEIKKLNYSFLLNLVEHKFNFNEDGSLTVTATYIAQFENSTHNYNFNLLGTLKEDLQNAKSVGIGSLFEQTLALESSTGTLSTIEQKETFEILKTRLGYSELDVTNIIDELGFNLSEEQKQDLIKNLYNISLNDLNEISKILNNKESLDCLEQNSLVVRSANSSSVAYNPNNGPVDSVNKDFSTIVDRTNKIIERYSRRKKDSYYKKLFNKLIEKDNIKTIQVKKETKQKWDNFASSNGVSDKPNFSEVVSVNILNPIEEQQTLIERDKASQVNSNAAEILKKGGVTFDRDTKTISYITLGNIIESAFEIVKEAFPAKLNEIKRQNIVCGNISNNSKILDISNQNSSTIPPENRNLLDIPIELKLFKLFLIENVVKPQKDTYSLFSFIKDIIAKLVVGVLNGSNLYNTETQAYSDTTLATTVFSLGNASNPIDNPLARLIEYTTPEDFQTQANFYYINNINTHTDYYTYFLIYDKKFIDFYPNNDPIKDEKMGIYHYTVGQDYGLLKAANFSRIDTPYLKEAKAVGKKTFYLGQFRDRYNVNLTMVGNNIYYPGMMLYIQPSAEAVQTVNKNNPEANPSFSQITGIGGYYFVEKVDSTISEEGYETKLDCIWQYDGTEKPEETVNDLSKCDITFSKAETRNLFTSLFTKAENEAAQTLADTGAGTEVSVSSSLSVVRETTGGEAAIRRGIRRGDI